MGRIKVVQGNFTGGEWSPRLHDRADLEKYWNAVECMENWVIYPQGGVTRRPGWHFVAEVKDSTRKGRLIPFIFSNQQSYIVEAGDENLRFFMNHGQIQTIPSAIKFLVHFDGLDASTTFTDSSSGGHVITAHGTAQLDTDEKKFGPSSGRFWNSGDYLSAADHADYDLSGGTWAISFWYRPQYQFGGGVLYKHGTDADNYFLIDQYVSGADLLVRFRIVSGGATILQLVTPAPGVAMNAWNFVTLGEDGNFYYLWLGGSLVANSVSTVRPANYTGTPLMGGDGILVIEGWLDEFCIHKGTEPFSSSGFAPPTTPWGISGAETVYEVTTSPYKEEDLAGLKWEQSADTMWITHPKYKPQKLTRTGHTAWSIADVVFTDMPDWDDTKGWPHAGCFHEQRFCYAGTSTYPQTVWLSKSGDYDDFGVSTPVVDADGLSLTIPASKVDMIYWLASIRSGLITGSGGGVARIFADGGLTPTSNNIYFEAEHRALDAMPIKVGSVVLFLQEYARKLRELAYNNIDETFHAPDLVILAEHITLGGVQTISYQAEPNYVIWAPRADGVLLHFTYLRDEKITAWGRWITDGLTESAAVIPDPTGSFDELWAIHNRTIGGEVKRYVEYSDPNLMVDSGITYSGAPTNTVTGLDHLEGETVDIVGDGCVYPQAVVTSGAVTLVGPAAGEIQVGLPYTSKIITMKPNVPVQAGSIAGSPKGWAEVWISLLESSGVTINGEVIPFRKVGDLAGAAITPFTGLKRVSQLGWNDGRITIEQSQPLPCTVRALIGTLEFGS